VARLPESGCNMSHLVKKFCDIEGYQDEFEAVESIDQDIYLPNGLCLTPECSYTTEVEPDQRAGYCECCGHNSVQSLFVLMGVI